MTERGGNSQCRINHGAEGARARGLPAEGAPEQNILFYDNVCW